jgi:hypothetical protein
MTSFPTLTAALDELHPHLLYCSDAGSAALATWRLKGGQESLAIFTTAEAAGKYQAELEDSSRWTIYQPPRDKLAVILESSLSCGIRIAALDPAGGSARTLFDLVQVAAAARQHAAR